MLTSASDRITYYKSEILLRSWDYGNYGPHQTIDVRSFPHKLLELRMSSHIGKNRTVKCNFSYFSDRRLPLRMLAQSDT
jgi:hypothetical protein